MQWLTVRHLSRELRWIRGLLWSATEKSNSEPYGWLRTSNEDMNRQVEVAVSGCRIALVPLNLVTWKLVQTGTDAVVRVEGRKCVTLTLLPLSGGASLMVTAASLRQPPVQELWRICHRQLSHLSQLKLVSVVSGWAAMLLWGDSNHSHCQRVQQINPFWFSSLGLAGNRPISF